MGRLDNLLTNIWDSKRKKFCGRAGRNWAEICAFFVVFYAMLMAYFCGMLSLFYQFVSDEEPLVIGSDGYLQTPGLSIRPRTKVSSYYTTLIYATGDNVSEHTKDAVQDLNEVLRLTYLDAAGRNVTYKEAHKERYSKFWRSCKNDDRKARLPCLVDYSELTASGCDEKNNYGYSTGKPCILVRLNRVFDWKPKAYRVPVDTMSPDLKIKAFQWEQSPTGFKMYGDLIWLDCFGEDDVDKDHLGAAEYQPLPGFPIRYFPYRRQYRYLSPAVFLRFQNAMRGLAIKVHCRVYAQNVKFDTSSWEGGFHFELFLNNTGP